MPSEGVDRPSRATWSCTGFSLHVVALVDPMIDQLGHDVHSAYVVNHSPVVRILARLVDFGMAATGDCV